MTDDTVRVPGVGFLLSQLGAHSSRRWGQRLAEVGLDSRTVMLFRFVALNEGRSQGDVARAIGLPASRIVAIVDRLERDGWVERRPANRDRRANALHLTARGHEVLATVMEISAAHEAELTRSLDPAERAAAAALLRQIAADAGLIDGVHPGFADPPADEQPPEEAGSHG
jgi:DNA-binding MarR family transcriptional regulator